MIKYSIYLVVALVLAVCFIAMPYFDQRRTCHEEPLAAESPNPEPTALADPALTDDPPARAQLSEPASAVDDSPSFTLPEATQKQVSLSDLEGDIGEWVRGYVKDHPNGPWIKIPNDAKLHDLLTYAACMKVIIEEQDEKNARILEDYGQDLIAFSKDQRVRQNDRDKQEKLKNALNSIWPGAMK